MYLRERRNIESLEPTKILRRNNQIVEADESRSLPQHRIRETTHALFAARQSPLDLIKPEGPQDLGGGGAAGEALDRAAVMDDAVPVVGVPVAAAAQDRAVCLAEDGRGGGIAEVAEQGAGVLGEEEVGGVNIAVAAEAELG